MSERLNTPFTNEHFADWCQKMVGQPYWYGTCVYKATNSLLSRKSNQYPSSYASSRMSRYKQDIANKTVVSDCIGGCKGYAWTGGGQGVLEAIGTDKSITSKYGSKAYEDASEHHQVFLPEEQSCQRCDTNAAQATLQASKEKGSAEDLLGDYGFLQREAKRCCSR